VKQFLYNSFSRVAGDRILWRLSSNRLRILCYHGVCADNLMEAPWIPQYFVTKSAFEMQLQYLQDNCNVLPLGDGVSKLRNGSLPPRAVCITFDDGYANNLCLAYTLLRKYQMPATIFLSSAYIRSGELLPFLKLKLIQLNQGQDNDVSAQPLLEYKSNPLDQVVERVDGRWGKVKAYLSEAQYQTLRSLTEEEVKTADQKLIEFGAHGDTHCILRNESPERREREIRSSIARVGELSGRPVRFFSYPNGERGDFNESDKAILRAEGIHAAVSGIAGANNRDSDLLELKRYPVTIGHDRARFRAEVTGFRTGLLRLAGRRIS